mgnify:FL=1
MPSHLDTRSRGDFVVMHLMQHLADAHIELAPTIARDFPNAGTPCEKEFHVDELPFGPGFLTMPVYDFEPSKHRVLTNGELFERHDPVARHPVASTATGRAVSRGPLGSRPTTGPTRLMTMSA